MAKQKKKFKDTTFGKILLQKIPSAAGLVGSLLPDKGVLGIVKNLIGKADISDADKEELLKMHQEYETEMFRLEIADRDSARNREVGMAKLGRSDWMMNLTGIFSLLSVLGVVYVVLFQDIADKELFYFIAGAVFGYGNQVVGYFFGSSKGSKDKDKKNFLT